jgi:hypothetical protein
MSDGFVGGGLYILGVSKVVFEQMFEYPKSWSEMAMHNQSGLVPPPTASL